MSLNNSSLGGRDQLQKGALIVQPIVYIDTSAIRNEKLEQLEVAMKSPVAFVELISSSSSKRTMRHS